VPQKTIGRTAHDAASRLRSGSQTRLRSAAKRQPFPQLNLHLTNLFQDLTETEVWPALRMDGGNKKTGAGGSGFDLSGSKNYFLAASLPLAARARAKRDFLRLAVGRLTTPNLTALS